MQCANRLTSYPINWPCANLKGSSLEFVVNFWLPSKCEHLFSCVKSFALIELLYVFKAGMSIKLERPQKATHTHTRTHTHTHIKVACQLLVAFWMFRLTGCCKKKNTRVVLFDSFDFRLVCKSIKRFENFCTYITLVILSTLLDYFGTRPKGPNI